MRRLLIATSFGAVLGFTCALALSAPAYADETPVSDTQVADASDPKSDVVEPSGDRKPRTGVEEIVVTARKREENLQDTPISISAFGEQSIRDLEIRRLDDLQREVPSLQFDASVGQANAARIYLRGTGNGDPIITDDPGVGIYLDGVYLPRAQGQLVAVSDIERIEVLRGPQGTLFGKNTIGGAINIITKKPDFSDFNGYGEIRVRGYGGVDTRIAMNVPIVPERVAARFTFATQYADGYIKNRFNKGSGTVGNDKLIGGRAQFLITPNENWEFLVAADLTNEPRDAYAAKCKVARPSTVAQVAAIPSVSSGRVDDPGGAGGAAFANFVSLGSGLVNNAFPLACQLDDGSNIRTIRQDGKLQDSIKSRGTTAIATWDITEDLMLKSTSSWRRLDTERYFDADGTFIPLFQDARGNHPRAELNSMSQEFNLTGSGMDKRLNWTVGAYGFKEDNANNSRNQLSPVNSPGFLFEVPDSRFIQPTATNRVPGTNTLIGQIPVFPSVGTFADTNPNAATAFLQGRPNFLARGAGLFPLATGRSPCLTTSTAALVAAGFNPTAAGTAIAAINGIPGVTPGAINNENARRAGLAAMRAQQGLPPDPALTPIPAADGTAATQAMRDAFACVRAGETAKTQTTLRASTLSYAAYGQFTYDVSDALKITGGLRFTSEKKRIFRRTVFTNLPELTSRTTRVTNQPLNLIVNPALLNPNNPTDLTTVAPVNLFELTERIGKWTPLLNVQYFLSENFNTYLNLTRGFKSGGFNGRADSAEDNAFFAPEILYSYEAGFKSQWFDNRLTINGAYYQNTYKDIQLTVVTNNSDGNLVVLTDNAGAAKIHGTEFEVRGVVLPGLQLSSSIGITAARYTEFDRVGFGNVKLPGTPAYTANFAATYGFSLGDMGDVLARISWRHEGKKGSDVADPHFTRVNKHGTLGARIALSLADGKTELALFGNNLLDREYFSNAIDLSGSIQTTLRYYAPPRTYGLELRRNF